jgi:hypothetical protein
VRTSNETQAVTPQPPRIRSASRSRNIAVLSAPKESCPSPSSTSRATRGRKTANERSAGTTNSVKTATKCQESASVENATSPIADAASTPEHHAIVTRLQSTYDRESVRRARRPPFQYEEFSVEPAQEAAVPSLPSEPSRRKRGRPPKLTKSVSTVTLALASSSEPSSIATTATRRRLTLTREIKEEELSEELPTVGEAGGPSVDTSENGVINETPVDGAENSGFHG